MNRCTIIDRLEDEYGIKPKNLTEREKAIIGLCTNQFLDNEEQALRIHDVVGRSKLLPCNCEYNRVKSKVQDFCGKCGTTLL
jgi:hypothetical protein